MDKLRKEVKELCCCNECVAYPDCGIPENKCDTMKSINIFVSKYYFLNKKETKIKKFSSYTMYQVKNK